MARDTDYPTPWILDALKTGVPTRNALRTFRAEGGRIATTTWNALAAQLRSALAGRLDAATQPLNRRPTAGEISPWSTRYGSGFLQQVEVFVRRRGTTDVTSIGFSVRGEGLRSRSSVLREAMALYGEFADDYDEEVLGVVYTGTYELVPTEDL